jgi:hypothetical protein
MRGSSREAARVPVLILRVREGREEYCREDEDHCDAVEVQSLDELLEVAALVLDVVGVHHQSAVVAGVEDDSEDPKNF